MKFILILLGTIIGVILFLFIVFYIVYRKFMKTAKSYGMGSLKNIAEEIRKGTMEVRMRPKQISGVTDLMKRKIARDFPNFSDSELFNKTETSLRCIFNSLEEKELKGDLILLNDQLKEIIADYKTNDINVKYDDVKFHKFTIKNYTKKDGVATINIATSVEYYYSKMKKNKVIEKYDEYKKQTSYSVDFIYVYDISKVKDYEKVLGITCPNCGAPVKDLNNKVCRYCNTGLEDINLKNWFISSYKEDN